MMDMRKTVSFLLSLFLLVSFLSGCVKKESNTDTWDTTEVFGVSGGVFDLNNVPEYSGFPYVAINGNNPFFEEADLTEKSYESYSNLDRLGRCGAAVASIGKDLMPTEQRENISKIKPTGWQTSRYDCVPGNNLYNRCHLIGYQLTGENANEKNLITGTRYLNADGMLPFENMVADYIKETENHVLYRSTPIFEGDNLVASGVLMEAKSVEDSGDGILFCVYCYNIQPNIVIDYSNGDSYAEANEKENNENASDMPFDGEKETYILNTSSGKFHKPSCTEVPTIKEKNKEVTVDFRENLLENGYKPCRKCNP